MQSPVPTFKVEVQCLGKSEDLHAESFSPENIAQFIFQHFSLKSQDYSLSFKDPEGDFITLVTDADYLALNSLIEIGQYIQIHVESNASEATPEIVSQFTASAPVVEGGSVSEKQKAQQLKKKEKAEKERLKEEAKRLKEEEKKKKLEAIKKKKEELVLKQEELKKALEAKKAQAAAKKAEKKKTEPAEDVKAESKPKEVVAVQDLKSKQVKKETELEAPKGHNYLNINDETSLVCTICEANLSNSVYYRSTVYQRFTICEACESKESHQYPLMKIKPKHKNPLIVFAVFPEEVQAGGEDKEQYLTKLQAVATEKLKTVMKMKIKLARDQKKEEKIAQQAKEQQKLKQEKENAKAAKTKKVAEKKEVPKSKEEEPVVQQIVEASQSPATAMVNNVQQA